MASNLAPFEFESDVELDDRRAGACGWLNAPLVNEHGENRAAAGEITRGVGTRTVCEITCHRQLL